MFRDGFIKGLCHAGDADAKIIKETGFNWLRYGFSDPFNTDGGFNEKYYETKEKLKVRKESGFKIMMLSPNPGRYAKMGIDTSTKEGLQQVENQTAKIAADLAGLVDGWQIANEMNVYFFRAPLNFDQSIDFIAAGLRGVRSVDKDILLGFNMSEFSESSEYMTQKLLKQKNLFNYLGYDGYYGTWVKGAPRDYIDTFDRIYEITGLPIILQEFGFASTGGIIEPGDYDRYVQTLGFKNFEDAKARCNEFLELIPKRMAEMIKTSPVTDWPDNIWLLESHLVKKWSGGSIHLPHTPAGQAQFYEELLPMLAQHKHLLGAFIFSWQDENECFFCHDKDCPCETAWGLNDNQGNPKPAYRVVRKYLTM
ncbi:MAG: glycosyl hydrolase 53 family protein [Treponema sp.]|nr:glycosyl hydrolase 53 family protein [Treponema sp.]